MTFCPQRSLRRAFLCLVAVFASIQPIWAATINVPSNATPTIQSGIDAASNGDIVLVREGTYYENIDFKGKAITVTAGGPSATASTIIDGGSKGPAITFKSGETRSAVLSYFSIQNGGNFETYTGSSGAFAAGGIVIDSSAPTLLENLILHNNCWSIYATQSAPLIQGNTIFATQDPNGNCSFGGGAGIYISGNLNGPSQSSTAGMSPMIVGNIIQDNVESGLEDAGGNGGAGIAVWGGSPIIAKNIIRNNASPGGSGGAINIEGGTNIAIEQNLIYGNSAGCGGGALAFDAGSEDPSGFGVLIVNNTIVDNTYDKNGGGFSECTNIAQIYPNPDQYGNGNTQEVLVNNIIAGNTSDRAIDGDYAFDGISEEHQPIFDHNLFYNAGGPVFGTSYVDVSTKYGNISANPQFVDPANHDYHLRSTSPAIDAGNNSVLQSLQTISGAAVTTDFDSNPRLQDATGKGYPNIDMGAYEYAGQVDASATTVVLTSSAYSGAAGSNYTFTATLASALGTPTGSIAFFLDGKQIGVSLIGADGIATLTNFLLAPGVHNLYAAYAGAGAFTPATSVIIIVEIDLYQTTLLLTSSLNPSLLGQSVTFTATVSSADPSFTSSSIKLTDTLTNTLLATLTPNSAGVATFTTAALVVGSHGIYADDPGDSEHSIGEGFVNQQVTNGFATTTTLTSSVNPANVGQSVTFTATVTSAGGTPAGLITFTDGATTLGTATLVNGVATYTTSTLAAGTHPIAVAYDPAGTSFNASTANLSEVINGIATSTSLAVAPTTAVYGISVVMSSAVSSSGTPLTGGTIAFMDGAAILGTYPVTAAAPNASLSITTLIVGTHVITAVYSGDATHNTSTSAPVTVAITGAVTTLTLASPTNPALAFQEITLTASLASSSFAKTTARTITFFSNGVAIGTGTTNTQGIATLVTSLSAGNYSLISAFGGDTSLTASTSASVAEIVNKDASLTTMGASPNPGYSPGGTVNLVAAVKPVLPTPAGSTVSPSGTYTFYDGSTAITTLTAPILADAPPASISNFAVGVHILTAVYSGDSNYLPSISAPVTLNIVLSDFTLTADPTLTIQTGHHKDLNLTLASFGSFTDTVALSCGLMPADASCIFAGNGSLLSAGKTLPSTVRIDTDAIYNYLSSADSAAQNSSRSRLHSGIAYALLLPVSLLVAARRRRALRRSLGGFASLLFLLMVTTLTGCSGHYPGHTPPGTYTITISSEGVATHIKHAATLTLVVTE